MKRQYIIVILLICIFLNLIGLSVIFETLLFLFLLLINRKIKFARAGFILVICLLWTWIAMTLIGDYPISYSLNCFLSSCMAYIIGNNINMKHTDGVYENGWDIKICVISSCSMAIYEILNCYARLIYQGDAGREYSALYQKLLHRNSYNIWNGDLISSTAAQQYFIGIVCLPPILIPMKRSKSKAFLIILYCLSIYFLFDLGSRTSIYIAIIVIILCIIQFIKSRKLSMKRLIQIGLSLLVITIVLVVFRNEIISLVINSTFAQRIIHSNSGISSALDDNSRIEVYMYILENMSKYPFGGMPGYFGLNTSAHNQFLNFYQIGGIISFFPYILFIAIIAIKVIRFRNKENSIFVYFYKVTFLSIIIMFLFESPYLSNPIFNAYAMLFFGLCENMHNVLNKKISSQRFLYGEKND